MNLDGLRVNHAGLDTAADGPAPHGQRHRRPAEPPRAGARAAAQRLDRQRPAGLRRREGEVGRRDPGDAGPARRDRQDGAAVERRVPGRGPARCRLLRPLTSAASDRVRVTVAAGTRRVDLVLPGAVPVAELLPELARSLGLLDAATVYGGYRLVTAEGRELAADAGLTIQGVEDGGVLTVTAGVDEPPPRVYDDVVEAMADVVERDLEPWEPAAGRRTALWPPGLLLGLGRVALLTQRGSRVGRGRRGRRGGGPGRSARSCCRVPSTSPRRRSPSPGWARRTPRSRADARRGPGGSSGCPWPRPAAAALLAGLVGAGRARRGPRPDAPAGRRGAIFLATGLVDASAPAFDPAVVLTTVLVLVGHGRQRLPVARARRRPAPSVDQLTRAADITADPAEIDPARSAADARVAHEILVALSATVGLLLVLVAPLAVSLGLAGTAARGAGLPGGDAAHPAVPHRRRGARRAGLRRRSDWSSVAVAVLWLHPDWRPAAAVALAATGGVAARRDAAARHALGAPGPARRRRRERVAAPAAAAARRRRRPPRRGPRLTGRAMATKRDLVEAHAVRAAPPGHRVRLRCARRAARSSPPGRAAPSLGGLVLAGAAAGGRRGRRGSSGRGTPTAGRGRAWSSRTRPGRATSSSRRAATPSLRPVLNATSAQAGARRRRPRRRGSCAQETIDEQADRSRDRHPRRPRGAARPRAARPDAGGPRAPGTGAGLRVRVAAVAGSTPRPGRRLRRGEPGRALRRRPGGSRRHRGADGLRLPAARRIAARGGRRAGHPARRARPADPRGGSPGCPHGWLALFPAGGDLAWPSFGLTGFGRPAPGAGSWGVPAGARVGDVLTTGDGSFLLTRRGPAELTDFALAVYRHVTTPRGRLTDGPFRTGRAPLEHVVDDAPRVGRARKPYLAARWPASRLSPRPRPAVRRADRGARARRRPCSSPRIRSVRRGSRPDGAPTCGPAAGEAGPRVRRTSWTPRAWPTRSSARRPSTGSATATPSRRWSPRRWLDLFERGVPPVGRGGAVPGQARRRVLTQHSPGSGSSRASTPSHPRPSATPWTKERFSRQTSCGVLAGQRVERAVGEQDLVVLDARLVALVRERLGQPRPVVVGPARGLLGDRGAAHAAPFGEGRVVEGGLDLEAVGRGAFHAAGQDVADQVVAPGGQRDGPLACRSAGRASRADRRPGRCGR